MARNSVEQGGGLDVAVIGSGVAGMSAAWLLSRRHKVTLYEAAPRLGGHTNTLLARTRAGREAPVDTGFIVYNEKNYPNLVALFDHLGVATRASDMSFAVSLEGGALEYGSTNLRSLFAQKRNLVRPRFWSMIRDLQRFYREAPSVLEGFGGGGQDLTLGEYLDAGGYGDAFQNDHLLPQAAAIWSCDLTAIRAYPVGSFIRFFENHGLLEIDIHARPQWRTVVGGSRSYIGPLTASYADGVRLGDPVQEVTRAAGPGVTVTMRSGHAQRHDQVVIATHADQALALIHQPTPLERQVLGAFRYTQNDAVLHTDATLMPRRRTAWSAWNYVSRKGSGGEVTYWMNRLQGIEGPDQFFVSLNPGTAPRPETVIATERYEHPLFDAPAIAAQRRLWALQNAGGLWFCGAHFGAGFHEDGLQSGLAVAEAIGGVRRPWRVKGESARIFLDPPRAEAA